MGRAEEGRGLRPAARTRGGGFTYVELVATAFVIVIMAGVSFPLLLPRYREYQVRSAVWQVDREQPLYRMESAEAGLANRNAGGRATTQVLGFLAVVALVLAAVGTYGVMAYTAAQRVREIGIRLALGAAQGEVRGMFVRDALVLVGIGVAIGLGAAIGLTRLMASQLFGVSPLDPLTHLTVALVLTAAAGLASYLSAQRASALDPVEVLKGE